MPAFAHNNLHSMTQLMMDITAQHIAELQHRIASSSSSSLQPVDLKPEFTALTFSIITSCAFGTSLSSLPQAPHILHRTFHTLLDAISVRNLTFIPHIPVLSSLPLLHLPAIQRGRREVDELVSAIIAQRRSGLSSPLCAGHDLLSLLLKEDAAEGEMSAEREQAVRDQTLAFIFAGHETTAGLMSWMFAQLVRSPQLVQQLRDELQRVTEGDTLAPHHLPQLALLDAVINETLRLYPPAPVMFRRCIAEHTLSVPAADAFDSRSAGSAVSVPAGAFILCDIYALHRVPEYWGDDAADFRPSRWLQSGRPYSHPAAFLPFSAGQRSCVGQQFALLEARVMTAQFIAAFDMQLPAERRLHELFGEIKISYAPRNLWANITLR
jgi:cytochrome P450/NADPH-cytochrome P450 reductase